MKEFGGLWEANTCTLSGPLMKRSGAKRAPRRQRSCADTATRRQMTQVEYGDALSSIRRKGRLWDRSENSRYGLFKVFCVAPPFHQV